MSKSSAPILFRAVGANADLSRLNPPRGTMLAALNGHTEIARLLIDRETDDEIVPGKSIQPGAKGPIPVPVDRDQHHQCRPFLVVRNGAIVFRCVHRGCKIPGSVQRKSQGINNDIILMN